MSKELTEQLFIALVKREREPGYWDWQELARRASQIARDFETVVGEPKKGTGEHPQDPWHLPLKNQLCYIWTESGISEVSTAKLGLWLSVQPKVSA